MPTQKVNYKNCRIEISGEGDQVQLSIDDKPIAVQYDPANDRYSAFDYLAYSDYDTPLELAQAIVDNRPGSL